MADVTIRLVLVDDHPVVRDGLSAILSTQPDFSVVGEADAGPAALRQVEQLQPDVLLLDLELPEMDGVAVLEQLQQLPKPPRVLVFTAFDTDERIVQAVRAGAQGYLLKGAPREELFRAIRTLYAGGSTLQPVVASRLLRQMQAGTDVRKPMLTDREREVLALVAQGAANKAIAADLGITERTVKFHVSTIMHKLDAANRTEAVTLARERGEL